MGDLLPVELAVLARARFVAMPGCTLGLSARRVRCPRMSCSNNAQWDDSTDEVGLNSRIRVIFEPGRYLFVVLNQGWSTFGGGTESTETDSRFKVSYMFRL
jgi:hypothetical protein